MNKKYILCILIVVMVILNSKHAFTIRIISKTYDITPESMRNTSEFINENTNNKYSIGKLTGRDSEGTFHCTASVIDTRNGNIAITAAHCLYDQDRKEWFTELEFFPGFDNGEPGRFGNLTVYKATVWTSFQQSQNNVFDYGFVKFYYNGKVQDNTGAFGYDLVPPTQVQTTVFGYPLNDGGFQCNQDGNTQCMWQGTSVDNPTKSIYRNIPVDIGYGSSGGPWLRNYDGNTNTGTIVGISSAYIESIQNSISWLWEPDEFIRLLNAAENM